ncbi:hypothetical protein VB780_09730 [Leptolyngbya sp. CCNP1308]|uniref:hypothetical protein n=1 Tax=Leptolyngbya sp. CCNP1308 TaxID=3110255 RepID=UPI002B21DD65|nr:hypothetical protein [Leptolyngbya sp. CCNP1308]MEA5448847.1 hypothetical protein [Leptolyngbya sp. CCNP1308]
MIEISDLWASSIREFQGYFCENILLFAENPIFPAVTALLGATTGALINQSFVDRRERLKARKEAEAIRSLLRLEIDLNLSEINSLRVRVITWLYEEVSRENAFSSPLDPPFTTHKIGFESLISDVPKAMSPSEIEAVYELYTTINYILKAKDILHQHGSDRLGRQSARFKRLKPYTDAMKGQKNSDPKIDDTIGNIMTEDSADKYEHLISFLDKALRLGNPLH